jgi:type I restriction enzyme S subunit
MSWENIVKENSLDVSIINYSKIDRFRIDADFYSKVFLVNEEIINRLKSQKLSDICIIKSGTTPKDRDDELKNGILLLKTTDIRNLPLSLSADYYHISEEINKKMRSTQLQEGDVLINIVGATLGVVGRASIVPNGFAKANITQAMALIRSIKKDFLPSYIFIFLLSKYGNLQAQRLARPTGQYNLNLQEVSAIRIPEAGTNFQKKLSNIVLRYGFLYEDSMQKYREAEQLLLKEIGLDSYKATNANVAVQNYKKCFIDNRFDAEYWQKDFDIILNKIFQYKKGSSTIGSEFKQIKGSFKSEKDIEYNYIEISDLNVLTGEVEYTSIVGTDLPANAKIRLGKKQLITSKVRPNRGATAILDCYEGYIVSGAFTVLAEKENINLETLMVYLKTKPIRDLLLRYNSGTSYPVITDSDVLKLPMPLIDRKSQKKISELVDISTKERQEAKLILEKAKQAVEIFIEKGENEAIKFLS